MVYVILRNLYYERDVSDPIIFDGVDIIAIFRNDLKLLEFLRRIGVRDVNVSNLPKKGECKGISINLVVCNAYSDL